MTTFAFILIVLSALAHALWNLLVKQSRDKTIFIWWMFFCSGGLLNLLLLFLPQPFPVPDWRTLLLALAGGFCFVSYHLFNGRAYREGDLSLTYPLSQTAMLYVPLWGFLFLGERLSAVGLAGIVCIAAGAYCVQLRRLALDEVLRPFRRLGDASVQAALAAGFVYSVGAVTDKLGVSGYPPLYFTYLLVMSMFVYLTLMLLPFDAPGRLLAEWRRNRLIILCSGPVMMSSFLTFRFGLKLAPMSYAVPLRQVSLLIGVLIGVLFLGETCGRIRFLAACMILAGVFLIRFG
ncbi:putative membrane protein [Geothermobacter ehrlichii]|uniref:Putative membrane protein n=1 Tax=Geothermobacter ehrlichii TaxID=213224 RepID=A0A5D3WF84_9BACT|nr:DMT family transporter [Geothermobacter ehrlichii]TYO95433.1 putative membrane protein [Geothermobacter ehrlichii]